MENDKKNFWRWLNIILVIVPILFFDLKTFECFSLVARTLEWQTTSFVFTQQSFAQLFMQASGGHLPLLGLLLANFLVGAGIFFDKVGPTVVIAAQLAMLLFDAWMLNEFGMIDLCFNPGSIADEADFLTFLMINYLGGILVSYNLRRLMVFGR